MISTNFQVFIFQEEKKNIVNLFENFNFNNWFYLKEYILYGTINIESFNEAGYFILPLRKFKIYQIICLNCCNFSDEDNGEIMVHIYWDLLCGDIVPYLWFYFQTNIVSFESLIFFQI